MILPFGRIAFVEKKGFKYWDGLYEKDNQYIYVSRGVGCVGVPARIGMDPQYTVITLRRKK